MTEPMTCMFQSCAPAPNNARSKEAQAPAGAGDEDCGEKKAHRGRIDWLPGKRCASPQRLCDFVRAPSSACTGGGGGGTPHRFRRHAHARVLLLFCVSHMQFLCRMLSQVLCCPFSEVARSASVPTPREGRRQGPTQPAHLHFPNKTIYRCAQLPNNSCTTAVGTKSFPAPVSNVVCPVENSVGSLLRQPRSALEAGPSEAHAISFVHTPRPHLHRKGCTFFAFRSALAKGIMGNH